MMLIALASVGAAAVCAFILTRAFVRGVGPALMDHPNHRSLHDVPVRRTGGLAIVAGTVLGHTILLACGFSPALLLPFALCALAILGVSVVDDARHVPAGVRLGVHAVAAVGVIVTGSGLSSIVLPGFEMSLSPWIGATVTVLFVVWMTNLYNFMDGMDGFAGGMGAIGFATLGLLALNAGAPALALSCGVVAAACGGFLPWNLPPARIFMGDAGASVLGFLAAVVALEAGRQGLFPLWLAVLVFSPFIVDATMTLLRRLLAGERVWQAHRSHFYQRMVRMGWGHGRTTGIEYLLMIACSASALLAHQQPAPVQAGILMGWGIAYTALMGFVTILERRGRIQ